ncbi:MAG: phosphatidylserine decarboxylase [Clostridiales bacterium]|nr:phosphatidylserine decarboxylase [Clostridiales bacterium]
MTERRIDCYKDRAGAIICKKNTSGHFIRLLYTNPLGRILLILLGSKVFAKGVRKFFDSRFSKPFAYWLIRRNGISLEDFVPKRYISFHDFFQREILPDRRPLAQNRDALLSPADGKISVYQIDQKSCFKIKQSTYSISSLLRSSAMASYYEGGYFILVRLSVSDYHHYIYALSGKKSAQKDIQGFLHSVKPVAADYVRVYQENSRSYCTITQNSISVVQMEIGAMGVGRICNNTLQEADVTAGDPKGHFEFGGSSIVLLLPRGFCIPDVDLIQNTADGFETAVRLGEQIGKISITQL